MSEADEIADDYREKRLDYEEACAFRKYREEGERDRGAKGRSENKEAARASERPGAVGAGSSPEVVDDAGQP